MLFVDFLADFFLAFLGREGKTEEGCCLGVVLFPLFFFPLSSFPFLFLSFVSFFYTDLFLFLI